MTPSHVSPSHVSQDTLTCPSSHPLMSPDTPHALITLARVHEYLLSACAIERDEETIRGCATTDEGSA